MRFKSFLTTLGGVAIGLVLLWQAIVSITRSPEYIFPSPRAVFTALWENRQILLSNTGVTAVEILLGLIIAIFLGLATALMLQYSRFLRKWFLPVMLISQAIPVYALGPILMLWFGYNLTPKVIITVVVIYFPIATACYDGLRQTPQAYLNLAKTMNSNAWQTLMQIRMPAAMPSFASGLRVAATYAPIGAIVGEYVGGSNGLGYLMQYGINRSETALAFAAMLVITMLTICIYYGIDALLKKFITW